MVGIGSVGKDSLLRHLFGVEKETLNISPIPGSTTDVMVYDFQAKAPVRIINLPGFDDPAVEGAVWDQIRNCTLVIYMVDAERVARGDESARFRKVQSLSKGVEVVFNRCDLIATERFRELTQASVRRLALDKEPVYLSLEGDEPRSRYFEEGLAELRRRINAWMENQEKPKIFSEE